MPISLTRGYSRREALRLGAMGLGATAGAMGSSLLGGCVSGATPDKRGLGTTVTHSGGREFFVLLSDPHISSDPGEVVRGVNMHERLRDQVAMLSRAGVKAETAAGVGTRPQAGAMPHVLVNGDLVLKSDLDEVGCYEQLLGLLKPVVEAGLPLTMTLGNHDLRDVFLGVAATALDDTRTDTGTDHATNPAAVPIAALPHRYVHHIEAAHADWYLLDSLEGVKQTPGRVDAAQLTWLDRALSARPARPALVMVHHTPQWPEDEGFYGLTNTRELLTLLNDHRRVSGLMHGHSHAWWPRPAGEPLPTFPDDHPLARNPFPVIGLPSTAYVFFDDQPTGRVLCRLDPEGFTLKLEANDTTHAEHGKVLRFPWRGV